LFLEWVHRLRVAISTAAVLGMMVRQGAA